ncbi:hypothetical protein BGZ72_006321 [Mortierella alpina]|nr:hypothetical protein BGZ72_006321 [Mortierella alpina]
MRYGYDSVAQTPDQHSEFHIRGEHSTGYSALASLDTAFAPSRAWAAFSNVLDTTVSSALVQPRRLSGGANDRCLTEHSIYSKLRKTSAGTERSLGYFEDGINLQPISGGVLPLALPSMQDCLDFAFGLQNKAVHSYDYPRRRYQVLGKRRRQFISELGDGSTAVSGWGQSRPPQGQSETGLGIEQLRLTRSNPTRSFSLPPCPEEQQQGRISVPITRMAALNGARPASMAAGQAVDASSRGTRAGVTPTSALISEDGIGLGEQERSASYGGASTWSASSGSDGMHSGQFPTHFMRGNNGDNEERNTAEEEHDRERIGVDNDNEADYDRDRYFTTVQTTQIQETALQEQQPRLQPHPQPQHTIPTARTPSFIDLHQQHQHAMTRTLPGTTPMSRQFPVLPLLPQEDEPIAHQIRRAQSSHIQALQRQWEQQQLQQRLRQQSSAENEARDISAYAEILPAHATTITTGSSVATHTPSRAIAYDSQIQGRPQDLEAPRRPAIGGIPMSRGSATPPASLSSQSSLSVPAVSQTTSAIMAMATTTLADGELELPERGYRSTQSRGSNTIYVNYEGGTLKPDDKWRRGDQEMVGR